jgi:hypothetical protein
VAKVAIDNLASEITRVMQEYTEAVTVGIEKEILDTAKTTVDAIKAGSPVKTGRYKAGWGTKKEGAPGHLKIIIHNRTKPGLPHLLEFGHAKRGGGRVSGRPHIKPAEDEHVLTMDKRIEDIIKRGGG